MVCSDIKGIQLGDDHIEQHSDYLSSWVQVLRADKSAIFKAAAAAQRTCEHLAQQVSPKVEALPVAPEPSVASAPVIQVTVVRRSAGPR